jgi:hypothetical protein
MKKTISGCEIRTVADLPGIPRGSLCLVEQVTRFGNSQSLYLICCCNTQQTAWVSETAFDLVEEMAIE